MSRAEKKQARIKREAEWEVQMSQAALRYMDWKGRSAYSIVELLEAAGKESVRISRTLPIQERGRVLVVFRKYAANLETVWKEETDE